MNQKNTEAIEIANSIVKGIIDDTFQSYDSALRAYFRLVSIIDNKNEMVWAKKELSGYTNIKDIPAYRIVNFRDTKDCVFIHQSCRDLMNYIDRRKKIPYTLYTKVSNNNFQKKEYSYIGPTYLNSNHFINVLTTVSDMLFEKTNHILNDLKQDSASEKNAQDEPIDKLISILCKFPTVAKQLLNRHEKRETLRIEDEYDVQDLLHALLKIFYDDVRSEEWVPSYAGKASRMDFLLKNEQIVIEVKKTRDKLTDKEVGDQLIIDISRYSTHPNCKTLVCFVYDPEGRINNPIGLENDLNKSSSDTLRVIVKIEPKH
ncbi:hypothetical protein [uncultured Methanolobus sp.]|uniref:PD-(D/E)XK nuclease domain-containing protein n=1 Tax=uncultured Methanolobus sp. TaxID=218300 RepID=UPI0029C677D0|nr:hypothetical protein [uncultured Methanolobus sp.]